MGQAEGHFGLCFTWGCTFFLDLQCFSSEDILLREASPNDQRTSSAVALSGCFHRLAFIKEPVENKRSYALLHFTKKNKTVGFPRCFPQKWVFA